MIFFSLFYSIYTILYIQNKVISNVYRSFSKEQTMHTHATCIFLLITLFLFYYYPHSPKGISCSQVANHSQSQGAAWATLQWDISYLIERHKGETIPLSAIVRRALIYIKKLIGTWAAESKIKMISWARHWALHSFNCHYKLNCS